MRIFKRIFSLLLVPVLVFSVFSFQMGSLALTKAETVSNASGMPGGSPAASQAVTTYSWIINSYIKGTTTAIIPAVTGSTTQSNYRLNVYAENVLGYYLDPFEQSPWSEILTQPTTVVNFYYTARNYILTFESNGGTPIEPITAPNNSPVAKPTNPVKESLIFSGWYKDAGCTQLVSWPYNMPFQGATLYAGWSKTPVTLTFNSNNGTAVAPIITLSGASVEKPADPTRNGFRFDGWYYDISFGQPVTWPLTMPVTAITIYAKWIYVRYTVTFDSRGGTTVSPITVNPNTEVYPPNDPAKIGYTFEGWYYDNGTFLNPVSWPVLMTTNGFTVYAKWAPMTMTISFDSQGGSAIEPMSALVGSPITQPVQPSKFGYVFAGWLLNSDPFTFDIMPTEDITLTASWNPSIRYSQTSLGTFKSENGSLVPATSARAGEIITVVLSAKTNFYCGSSRFIIMYDSAFYTILGANKNAITPNAGNAYFANAIASYAGSTTSPSSEWPVTFVNGESSRFKFVGANFTASSQSVNKGKPLMINNDVSLFQIRLQVKPDAVGSGQIFMDKRWDRSATNTTGGQYYFYCTNATVLSSSGISTLNFDTDYGDSNKTVALDTTPLPSSNIIFNTDGGTPVTSMNGVIGAVANPPANPVKEGYTFTGWSPSFPASFPASDITLTALWQINSYNANFMVDGQIYKSVSFQYGAQITAPSPNPSKTGYTFISWSPALGTMGAAEKTFTATFLINSYNAYFMVDNQQYAKFLIEYNAQIPVPSNPLKTGYTFDGWAPTVGLMPASDKTFTAQFTKNSYYAYFIVDGETIASVLTPFGDQIIPPASPTKPGFAFASWSPALGTMGAADRTFTATWNQTVFNAYFVVDSIPYNTAPTTVGTAIVLPQNPSKTGFTFTGWANLPALMPASDMTMTAVWAVNRYTVTFLVDGNPYTTVNTDFGAVITLPTAPGKVGYTFNGWANLPQTMPAQNITLNANFSANTYNAVFKVDGAVYKNVPTLFGAEIEIPAAPAKTGYTFLGWLNVPQTMPANNVDINASFSVNSYTVTFMLNGSYYSSVTLPYGAAITLPAQPGKTGYTFTSWDPMPAAMPDYSFETSATFSKNIHNAVFMVDGLEYAVIATGYGDTIELPATPSKTGYAFLGWNNVPDQMPDRDVVITDNWAINSYDSLFIVDTQEYAIVTTVYGLPIKLPASPSKQGVYFGGWTPSVPVTMPASALEFTAVWVTQAYNAIFMVDGQEYARVLTGVGAPVEAPVPPAKQGFAFVGWDPALPYAMPAQDTTFNALWQQVTEITLHAKAGSTTIIDQTGGFICGLAEGISATDFTNNYVDITGPGELLITAYTAAFGTGTKVELINSVTRSVIKTYYIVIFGDVDGNGSITAADRNIVKQVASYQDVLPAAFAFKLAADLTQDGTVDAFDLNIIKAVIAGIGTIDQTNPGTFK